MPIPARLRQAATGPTARAAGILAVVGGLLAVTAMAPLSVVTAADGAAVGAGGLQRHALDDATTAAPERDAVRVVESISVAPAAPLPGGDSVQGYAADRLLSMGLGSGEYDCLYALWMRESRWNHRAENPTSGAYGIPQSLPGRKMASAGADWRTNPRTQVRWGIGYIKGRYGTPCAAWKHSNQRGWY